MNVPARSWTVVVPVKGGPAAKTRLHPPHGVSRWQLAHAMAEDCLTSVRATPGIEQVVVVSGDDAVADLADQLGLLLVPDPDGGLDLAVAAGVSSASGPLVAVLLGDLPALRPADLAGALAATARAGRAVVPDRAGTGTVLLADADLTPHRRMPTRFGAGSAAAHEELGYTRLDLDLPHLRTDVDDDASLALAVALGVGPATTAALADQGSSPLTPPGRLD